MHKTQELGTSHAPNELPDMMTSPLVSEIKPGMKVDIAPHSGRTLNLGCCTATGVIANDQQWDNPNK